MGSGVVVLAPKGRFKEWMLNLGLSVLLSLSPASTKRRYLPWALLSVAQPLLLLPLQPPRSLSLPCPPTCLSLSLSLPAFGSTKLLKWMVSAIHSPFYLLWLHTHYWKPSLPPTSTRGSPLSVLSTLDHMASPSSQNCTSQDSLLRLLLPVQYHCLSPAYSFSFSPMSFFSIAHTDTQTLQYGFEDTMLY